MKIQISWARMKHLALRLTPLLFMFTGAYLIFLSCFVTHVEKYGWILIVHPGLAYKVRARVPSWLPNGLWLFHAGLTVALIGVLSYVPVIYLWATRRKER